MMVSVQSTGKLERRMEVEVPAARVEQEMTQRLRNVSRTARLKGFRPGKAPLNIVRQQFGKEIHQEVVAELMRRSFAEAVVEQKLNPAGGPRIEPIATGEGQPLKYAATFEVFPDITINGLDRLTVDRPLAQVTDEDIDTMIESLRKQNPKWKLLTREARKDDRVTVDFTGTIDGAAFEGGKGEGVGIVLGAGQMLPEFESGLVGVTAETHKPILVRFPDDYHNKALAGKTASFDVTVKKVEEQELPEIDEEFCAAFGIKEGGIEALRQAVGDNMRRELEQNVRARTKNQVLDKLLAANPVELPASLVESQVRDMQIDMARRMGARDASQVPPREPFLEPARRRVALGLLINEIIRNEKIEVDRTRVNARLQDMVSSYDNPQEMMRAYQQNREAMHQVEMLVLEDQVVDWLLSRAKINDLPSTFKTVMNFGAQEPHA
jgi:trigger factor